MSFASSFVTYLKSKSTITSLVGSGISARIRPMKLKQGEALPAIRFVVSTGEVVDHLGGATGTETVSLQVDCYGNAQKEADSLRVAVRDASIGYQGTMGDVYVWGIGEMTFFWEFEDPVDASDSGAHRVIITCSVAYTE